MTKNTDQWIDSSVSIIVPLYQYPITQITWRPLFQAIADCSSTKFIIIINPNSGPGVDPDGWQPDRRYSRGILKLKAFANVVLVGYVRLEYCRRPLDSIKTDIEKYAGWNQNSDVVAAQTPSDGGLSMNGIFFDEVPNIFSEDIAEQLASLSRQVRDMKGFGDNCWVIHNPGTIPDIEFLAFWTKISPLSSGLGEEDCDNSTRASSSSNSDQDEFVKALKMGPSPRNSTSGGEPDLVVIFEGSFNDWRQKEVQERMARLSRYDRSQCCHIVHSIPQDNLKPLFKEIQSRGSHLYMTDLPEHFYESFGKSWKKFSDIVDAANRGLTTEY